MHVQGRADEILLVAMKPAPAIVARRPAGYNATHLPLHGHMITLNTNELQGAGSGPLIKAAAPSSFPIAQARGDTIVVGKRNGTVTLLHERVGIELHAPSDDLERIAASPASPYVLAATSGRLLVWNTDDILPTARRLEGANQFYAINPRRLMLTSAVGSWAWYDLATGVETPFRVPLGTYLPLYDGRSDAAVLTYEMSANAQGFLIARYGEPVIPVPNDVSAIMFLDGRLTVGTPGGEVMELEPARRVATTLAARPGHAVMALGSNGRWLAARWADGGLWRRGPDGREERTTLAPSKLPILIVQRDGRVCAATGPRIECWSAGGGLAVLATLPLEITVLELLTDELAIVSLADRGYYRVDLATGKATSIGLSGGMEPTMALEPGLAVTNRADNRVTIVDLIANESWPLNTGFFGASRGVRITPDGKLVVALAGRDQLLTWRLDLPQTPEATARWLDELTNATGELGTTKVGWR
jgi:hypothetical protein